MYLQCPEHLDKKAARSLKLRATKYCLIEQQLFWKDPGGILLRCLDKPDIEEVILESHEGDCGGHKYWKDSVVRISPHYRGWNGSLVPIGHKGRFLPLENSKKTE